MQNVENTKGKKSKTKILAIVGIVLIVVLGAFGVNWYMDQKNYISTDDAQITGDILNASAKIPGKVLKINVAEGDTVKKGEVLFSLETDQLQDQMNQAKAALEVAKATLNKAVGGARAQEIAGAQALVQQADAALNGADTTKANLEGTLKDVEKQYNDLISQMDNFKNKSTGKYDANYAIEQLDSARSKGAITEAQYTVKVQGIQQLFAGKLQYENQISQLKGQLKTINAQIAAAKAGLSGANDKLSLTTEGASNKDIAIIAAQVKAAQAAFDLAQLNYNNAQVKAPADGTVVQVSIHTGDVIGAGQPGISIVDMSKLKVTANVLESDLERVGIGQKVTMTIDAFSGEKFTGTVEKKGLATASVFSLFNTANASGNFTKVSQRIPVKIGFSTNGEAVIPGMSAEVKIKAN